MTNTIKDKIRVKDYAEFDTEHLLPFNIITPYEFKELIGNHVKHNIQKILFQTGEDSIYFDRANLDIRCEKRAKNDYYKFSTKLKIHYFRVESDNEYKDRLNKLRTEEEILKELVSKLGYKLERLDG